MKVTIILGGVVCGLSALNRYISTSGASPATSKVMTGCVLLSCIVLAGWLWYGDRKPEKRVRHR